MMPPNIEMLRLMVVLIRAADMLLAVAVGGSFGSALHSLIGGA